MHLDDLLDGFEYDHTDGERAVTPVCPTCETRFHRVVAPTTDDQPDELDAFDVTDPDDEAGIRIPVRSRRKWRAAIRCGGCNPPRTLAVETVVASSLALDDDIERVEAAVVCDECGGVRRPTRPTGCRCESSPTTDRESRSD